MDIFTTPITNTTPEKPKLAALIPFMDSKTPRVHHQGALFALIRWRICYSVFTIPFMDTAQDYCKRMIDMLRLLDGFAKSSNVGSR